MIPRILPVKRAGLRPKGVSKSLSGNQDVRQNKVLRAVDEMRGKEVHYSSEKDLYPPASARVTFLSPWA